MWYWIVGIVIFNVGFVTGTFWAGRERDDKVEERWAGRTYAAVRSER
jgi:hypothetical protein